MLHKIFLESDSACKNLDRLFLGGKQLICVNENARLTLEQLLTPFYEAMSVGNNRKRNIYSFCKRQKILIFNNTAAMDSIERLSLYGDNDGIKDRAIIHIIGESANPSFFILESRGLLPSITYKRKQRKLSIEGGSSCQLLNDFNSGERLEYNARFAILTNLRHISGGQKHFLGILEQYYERETYERWEKNICYMVDYHPQRCSEEFCPYYSECNHAGTIVDTLAMDRKIYREKEMYYSLEEAGECELLLKGFQAFKDKRVVITTHAYLLQMPEEILKEYTIIIDEDILQLQLLNKIHSVSVRCLEELIEKKIPKYSDIASRILRAGENEYQKLETNPMPSLLHGSS